jgi:hypothetical protein
MSAPSPTVFATYRARPDAVGALTAVLADHWPTLRRLGLVTDEPVVTYHGIDRTGGPYVVEVFTWISEEHSRRAHDHPEVARIWDAIGELVEPRGELPKWDFQHVQRVGG